MDVALAVVPFADVARPAIGLSLLKAGITARGFSSRIHYFNIEFAEILGLDVYTRISDHTPSDSMIGEWFFTDLVFGDGLPAEHEFIRNVIGAYTPPEMLARYMEGRKRRREFIERCARTLKQSGAPIVGFTTTFHQSCACLAIAKCLKEMPDPPIVVFGGANCEGEMGLQMLRSFEWVDYVCTREGDVVFPDFVERFLTRGDRSGRPGFLRKGEDRELTYPALIEDMDSLPIPDYDDYAGALRASSLSAAVKPEMQIEAARGCWWGAKYHCTFCGLNGDTMRYRSKSPDRVYEELRYLYKR
ncbi:MAG TPA: RiPP maturation radical SAM C-methyltransferase, partial [Bryobacteraceae bacterium]|nr:RiPP maturation radical SAM C-methyltransferase [Bryobacteraceae bacterium]